MSIKETEIWIAAKDGVGIPPRVLDCPECGTPCRKLPGKIRYVCHDCGSETTLDMTVLEHIKPRRSR